MGDEPESVAKMRGANGCRRYALPLCVIPELGQVTEDDPQSSLKEAWDVLHEDVAGS